MEKTRTRYLIICGILIIISIIVNYLDYEIFRKSDQRESETLILPEKIGRWKGTNVSLESSVYEILETESIIHRNYQSEEGSVFLSIVYYPDTKVDFHAPEGCLGGLGHNLSKKYVRRDIRIKDHIVLLKVAEILSSNKNKTSRSYYLYKAGNKLNPNYIRTRLNIAINKLLKKDTSAALIRITTKVNAGNDMSARLLDEFLSEILTVLSYDKNGS